MFNSICVQDFSKFYTLNHYIVKIIKHTINIMGNKKIFFCQLLIFKTKLMTLYFGIKFLIKN